MFYDFERKVFLFNPAAFLNYSQYRHAAAAVASMTGDTEDPASPENILESAWDLKIVAVFPIDSEEEDAILSGMGERITVKAEGDNGDSVRYAIRPLPPKAESPAELARIMGPLFVAENTTVTLTVKDTVSPGELALYYLVTSGNWVSHRAIQEGDSLNVVWQADDLDDIANENERDLVRLLLGIAMVVVNEFGLRRVIKEWKTAAGELVKLSAERVWAEFKATRKLPDPDLDDPYQPIALSFLAEKLTTMIGSFAIGKMIESVMKGEAFDPAAIKASYEDFLTSTIFGQGETVDAEDLDAEDSPPVSLSPELEALFSQFVNSLDALDPD